MPGRRPEYLSYLLRLWRVRARGVTVWRASLQSPQTGERLGFATLDKLVAFLWEQTGLASEAGGPAPCQPADQEAGLPE